MLVFELIHILVGRKYAKAPHTFHIEYGLCITFILALFEGKPSCQDVVPMSVSESADFCNFGKWYFATVSLGNSLPHPCL